MINPGNDYQGQGVKGSVQLGETTNGTLQIALDMEVFNAKNELLGNMTTFLYFSEGAAVYSYERLQALGWKGKGPEDIDRLDDIFSTRVPVRVTVPESYKDPKDGSQKTGASKLEILVGTGTVVLSKPVGPSEFKARLKAMGGSSGGGKEAEGVKPPF